MPTMTGIHLTPTEHRILSILGDGQPHRRKELLECLTDELANLGNLAVHLCNLRKKLRPEGEDIVCEYHRRAICYRWVRLIGVDDE